MTMQASPHRFTPTKWLDRFGKNGRCAACYFPRWVHPIMSWVRARPVNDFGMKRLSDAEAMALEESK